MLTKIREFYSFSPPGHTSSKIIVRWFDEHNHPTLKPHEANMRQHEVVLLEYVDSIVEYGVCSDGRGGAWALASRGSPSGAPFLLLTWGTLARAFYKALELHPSNENVKASLAAGLEVQVLHPDTPGDVYSWIRDYFNRFGPGASVGFNQILQETTSINASWQVFAHLERHYPIVHSHLCGLSHDQHRTAQCTHACTVLTEHAISDFCVPRL